MNLPLLKPPRRFSFRCHLFGCQIKLECTLDIFHLPRPIKRGKRRSRGSRGLQRVGRHKILDLIYNAIPKACLLQGWSIF